MLDILMLLFTALVIALIITCIGWIVGYIIIKIDSIMFALCYMLLYSFDAELEHQQLKEEVYKDYIIKNQNNN